MKAEILTIGDEVCRGEIVDTNSTFLAAELWELGIAATWLTSCRDDVADMTEALQNAVARADLVLVSGGLGPTSDDLTVEVLARVAGVGVVSDATALARVRALLEARGRPMTPNNARQADVPQGAVVLANSVGLAPGFDLALGRARVMAFPGVPREMKAIWAEHARERVAALRASAPVLVKGKLRVFGMGESQADALLAGLVDDVSGASLHYQVKFPEVWVKIVVRGREGEPQAAAQARLRSCLDEAKRRLGNVAYGEDDVTLAAVLHAALRNTGKKIAWAESCTGGLLGATLTELPGASVSCWGGFITYENQAKIEQLGVRAETLAAHGAVSPETALEMAQGALARSGVDLAVSITGIAGPDGGTLEKPVGTVCFCVARKGGPPLEKTILYPSAGPGAGSRDQVRTIAAYWAMNLLLQAAETP